MNRRALVLLLLGACGPDAGDASQTGGLARQVAHGPVVARIGAAEIGLHDVERVARETGLAPDKALDRLVAEQLLGQRAEESGYGRGVALERELKKARARALLEQTVERDITPAGIPASEVEQRFVQQKAMLDRPDSRAVSLLVFPRAPGGPGPFAGSTDAEAALARLTGLPLDQQHEQLAALREEAEERGQPLTLDQKLVPLRNGAADPALLNAIAALKEPGLVPAVVQTRRSAMVVLVDEIVPAHEATLAEHEAPIREQLANEARAARVKELVDKLAAQSQVQYDEEAIQQALADDSLLGNLP